MSVRYANDGERVAYHHHHFNKHKQQGRSVVADIAMEAVPNGAKQRLGNGDNKAIAVLELLQRLKGIAEAPAASSVLNNDDVFSENDIISTPKRSSHSIDKYGHHSTNNSKLPNGNGERLLGQPNRTEQRRRRLVSFGDPSILNNNSKDNVNNSSSTNRQRQRAPNYSPNTVSDSSSSNGALRMTHQANGHRHGSPLGTSTTWDTLPCNRQRTKSAGCVPVQSMQAVIAGNKAAYGPKAARKVQEKSRASPNSYAGAKFSDSPKAHQLPPPPLQWVLGNFIAGANSPTGDSQH